MTRGCVGSSDAVAARRPGGTPLRRPLRERLRLVRFPTIARRRSSASSPSPSHAPQRRHERIERLRGHNERASGLRRRGHTSDGPRAVSDGAIEPAIGRAVGHSIRLERGCCDVDHAAVGASRPLSRAIDARMPSPQWLLGKIASVKLTVANLSHDPSHPSRVMSTSCQAETLTRNALRRRRLTNPLGSTSLARGG